jgi:5-(carboxyamino)imidazole ribonucleotide synthase
MTAKARFVSQPQRTGCGLGRLKQVPCVLEKMLPLQLECSVIVARGADGACVNLPVQRNLHRDGILAVTEVLKEICRQPSWSVQVCCEIHSKWLAICGCAVRGVFRPGAGFGCRKALGGLVVNEMAPRPHNSGHYSMDACDVSQFELQVRTLAGLPLTQPRQHSPAIMLNLLGDIWPQHDAAG